MKQIDANLPSQIEDIVNHNSANGSSNGLVGESVPLEPEPQTAGQSAKPYEAALVFVFNMQPFVNITYTIPQTHH